MPAFHAALPYLVLWFAQLGIATMNRFGRYGDFSYGLYVFAYPLQQWIVQAAGTSISMPVFFAADFSATLDLAKIPYRHIKRPMLGLDPVDTIGLEPLM